ncbi:MAG TPA: hypothetical protein VM510_13200 [Caulifigura sp.]|jgi:hypothetical protein|nr:hypothetical protein [Caulifigura sp.]
MFADIRDQAQDLAQNAACRVRQLSQRTFRYEPPRQCAVRSAGILMLAASGAAAAWLAYRAMQAQQATQTPRHKDDYDALDQTSMESFPASDPPSFSPGTT